MNEPLPAIDWTQIPVLITVIAVLISRAWRSRELMALRERLDVVEEEKFEEMRAHNTTKRRLRLVKDELKEYQKDVSEDDSTESEAQASDDGEDPEGAK